MAYGQSLLPPATKVAKEKGFVIHALTPAFLPRSSISGSSATVNIMTGINLYWGIPLSALKGS